MSRTKFDGDRFRWFQYLHQPPGIASRYVEMMNYLSSGRRMVVLALVSLCLTCGFWVSSQQAEAAVYWGNQTKVGAASLLGVPNFSYFTPDPPLGFSRIKDEVCDVAVNETHLYWLSESAINRVSLDGQRRIETLVTGIPGGCRIALGESHVYWTLLEEKAIGRARLDGTEVNGSFISGLNQPCDVAVDGSHVYWAEAWGIGRAELDGGEVARPFVTTALNSCGVAVDDRYVYWGNRSSGAIGRARLDGSGVEHDFIVAPGRVSSVAVDPSRIVWISDFGGASTPPSIGSANPDGSGVNQAWVMNNSPYIGGLALDTRPIPAPITIPFSTSRPLRLGKTWHPKSSVAVLVNVWAAGPGKLTLSTLGVRWRLLRRPSMQPSLDGSVRWTLKIWPGGTGRSARRIRRQLDRRGRAPVDLEITFTEAGKAPISQARRVVLKAL